MQIRINKVGEVVSKGKYSEFTVEYNQDGKDASRVLRSFVFPECYHAILKAKPDDAFDISLVKDGKYWNWEKATPIATDSLPKSKGKVEWQEREWETKAEREQKQILIVRQSSLSAAVAVLGVGSIPQNYIDLAKIFEEYVFDKGEIQ